MRSTPPPLRWRREWLPAVVLFSLAFVVLAAPLPYALWHLVPHVWTALGGPYPSGVALELLILPGMLIVLAVAVAHRWRVGRPARRTKAEATTS